jgi:hypothetical protein
MLRRTTAAALLAMLTAAATATAAAADGVWVNGVRHPLVTGAPTTTRGHPLPLYVIAPVDPSRPLHPLADARTHGFGAHDHVIAISHAQRTCDLQLVVAGPKAKTGHNVRARMTMTPAGVKPLLYAVRLGARMQPLTWAARISRATTLGLARIIDTETVIGCSVS